MSPATTRKESLPYHGQSNSLRFAPIAKAESAAKKESGVGRMSGTTQKENEGEVTSDERRVTSDSDEFVPLPETSA